MLTRIRSLAKVQCCMYKSLTGILHIFCIAENVQAIFSSLKATLWGPGFMALLTTKFFAYHHHSLLKRQMHALAASEDCLETWIMHVQKQYFPANP